MEENATGRLDEVSYSLSGVDDDVIGTLLSDVLDGDIVGRVARLWVAFFNDDETIKGSPVLIRQDIMQDLQVVDRDGAATAILKAMPPGTARGRASHRVYSHADHTTEYPDDDFFVNVESVGVKTLTLG